MDFLVLGYDGTDSEALARRQAAREAHLAGVKRLKAAGNYHVGGPLLNEAGQMTGSAMVMSFENREALNQWLAQEPYTLQKVWATVEIKPMHVAQH